MRAFTDSATLVSGTALAYPVVMLSRLTAAAIVGVDAVPVSVEVDVADGLPGLTMVGLPDLTVRESRERVRTAIRNSGFPFPSGRVTVSLAPADLRKVGAAFDLPIALGILAASRVLPPHDRKGWTIVGGLSLDGSVVPTAGLLPIAVCARRGGQRGFLFPASQTREAAIVKDLPLHPVRTLFEAAQQLAAPSPAPAEIPPDTSSALESSAPPADDLADVRGQALAKRALEIAAAGGHHLLLSGPPGSGKTMLARRLPGILPPLTFDDALTVTAIHSVAGLLGPGVGLIRTRPFRAPHHTASDVSLVGGGPGPRPGEISLAHAGVLFLDELPEFSRRVLETLRQPLEEGSVHVARVNRSAVFPAEVMLVAAMNPCPCGYFGSDARRCICPPGAVARYGRRVSGPLRDRFDLALEVAPVPWSDLAAAPAEPSATVADRVVAARSRQRARQGQLNARLRGRSFDEACAVTASSAAAVLSQGVTRLGLSARGVTRVLRVARTIADLAECDRIDGGHLAESMQFRSAATEAAA